MLDAHPAGDVIVCIDVLEIVRKLRAGVPLHQQRRAVAGGIELVMEVHWAANSSRATALALPAV